MRRVLASVIALAAVLAAGAFAAGCGSEDLPSVSLAEAARSTRDAETARMTMRVEIEGMGLPQAVTFESEGITATAAPRFDMTLDLGPFLEAAGAEGDGETRVLVDGRRMYVDPPDVEGLDLPGGATWVTADAKRVTDALGIDGEALGELMRLSAEQQLAGLEAAGAVEEVGEEEVDGVRTTHLRGTVRMRDYLRALPRERRARVERALRELAERTGQELETLDAPTPIEIWVGEDKRVRRMRQSAELPAQEGVPAGSFDMTMEFDDFGTELDLDVPEGDEVFDATPLVIRAIREGR